ncbi:hypothetical protein B0J11DRAFT_35800 [Dendryphion nanum]|uniref:Cell wall mannoprotein PIR1-like C-terminal domain-containing protein n=1 Tax=Dendryphion nanum TaxID=256645 RepID=A0A9P9IZ23_9PLEO|nr:hypothetical protein B0J11DRAFT_35800 [Dendryphion nanum]
MRSSILLGALLGAIPTVFAQAVPEGIAPEAPPPPGCRQTVDGNFTIGIAVLPLARRETAAEAALGALQCSLKDGILRDSYGRTASIVANFQFQFDGPPQAGAIYTGGFSVCQNNSLALGGSTVWWRCMSGEFGNLYDRTIGDQCAQVRIVAQLLNAPSSSSSSVTPSRTASISTLTSGLASSTVSSIGSVTVSRNQTVSTAVPSISGSASSSVTSLTGTSRAASTSTPPNGSTGGAVPTRVPRRETFGFAISILGAALIL